MSARPRDVQFEKSREACIFSKVLFSVSQICTNLFKTARRVTLFCLLVFTYGANANAGCYERGIELQQQAEFNKADSKILFNKSLDAYLCAATNGNPRAAYLAAILSESGQSRPLPYDVALGLWAFASDSGIPEAQLGLAAKNCPEETICRDAKVTEYLVIQSAKSGNQDAINYLGSLYERGQLGRTDIGRSYSCYELAAIAGQTVAARNMQRLAQLYNIKHSKKECLERNDNE